MKQLTFLALVLSLHAVQAQTKNTNGLGISGGIQHITFLDKHASPLVYNGVGPNFGLTYQHLNQNFLISTNFRGGLLKLRPADETLQFYDPGLTGTSVGFDFSLLKGISKNLYLGGGISEDLILDFGEVGNFPWMFSQANLLVKSRWIQILSDDQTLQFGLDVPLMTIVTDMPYEQIPRVEGKAPDVSTLLQEGTHLRSWSSFQKFSIDIQYDWQVLENWGLRAAYNWSWFHDHQPKDFSAFQGFLIISILKTW